MYTCCWGLFSTLLYTNTIQHFETPFALTHVAPDVAVKHTLGIDVTNIDDVAAWWGWSRLNCR